MRLWRAHGWLAVGVLCAAAAGCGQSKVTQCNALVRVTRKASESLAKTSKPSPDSQAPPSLRALADVMDLAAGEAARTELALPELTRFSAEYQEFAKGVSAAARDMATASEANQPDRVQAATVKLTELATTEEQLFRRLNDYCQGP
jgi:hypothetical protein